MNTRTKKEEAFASSFFDTAEKQDLNPSECNSPAAMIKSRLGANTKYDRSIEYAGMLVHVYVSKAIKHLAKETIMYYY